MALKQSPLPLTDENQRLVNLRLLKMLSSYEPHGMKGLFIALDSSMKQNNGKNVLTYDGMRRAVQRDVEKLDNLADKPEELRRWLKTRKKSGMLQVRISENQFLLNNILHLLGLQLEDLFDRDKLPGKADETLKVNSFPIEENDIEENKKLLREINSKLDTVIFQQEGDKIRKTYLQRFYDFTVYLSFFHDSVFAELHEPEKTGFSFVKMKDQNPRKATDKSIYTYTYFFISMFLLNIHKKSKIHKLFTILKNNSNNDFAVGRLLCPLFLTGILIQLLINFLESAKRNKKPIFRIVDGNFFDFFPRGNYDNNIVLEKAKSLHKKTLNIIHHILDNDIKPDETLCIRYEILFVNFFYNTYILFQKPLPLFDRISDIRKTSSNKKEIEKRIDELFIPGYYITFSIEPGRLDYLDNYIKEIEDAQLCLENYYVGNVNFDGSRTSGKPITAIRRLPE